MSLNVAAIRADLVARLASIAGLQSYPLIPASPEVPCAILHPGPTDPHADMDGDATVTFRVQVLVQFADWAAAQTALDSYTTMGTATSIVDALEGGTGGTEDVAVRSIENYGQVDLDGVKYGTVTFVAEVLP